jgi:hypothetical protein
MRNIFLTLFFIIAVKYCCNAQLNVKVGYCTQYNTFKQTNNLFKNYNSSSSEISKKYKSFHFLHGLELGLRYHVTETLAFDLGLSSVSTLDNKTSRLINAVVIKDEWKISNRFIALGIENIYGTFGYGVQLGYSKWKYLKDFVGADSKQTIYEDNSLNLRFNFIIQAKSGNTAFALKPFYNYPFSKENISVVDKTLNGSTANNVMENFQGFGLGVVFYNGPQR